MTEQTKAEAGAKLADELEAATSLLSLAYQEFQKDDGSRHSVLDNSGRKVWLIQEDVMRDLWIAMDAAESHARALIGASEVQS